MLKYSQISTLYILNFIIFLMSLMHDISEYYPTIIEYLLDSKNRFKRYPLICSYLATKTDNLCNFIVNWSTHIWNFDYRINPLILIFKIIQFVGISIKNYIVYLFVNLFNFNSFIENIFMLIFIHIYFISCAIAFAVAYESIKRIWIKISRPLNFFFENYLLPNAIFLFGEKKVNTLKIPVNFLIKFFKSIYNFIMPWRIIFFIFFLPLWPFIVMYYILKIFILLFVRIYNKIKNSIQLNK